MNNLGLVHLRRGELEKALDYFEKTLQLCLVVGNFPLLAFVYSNKADFYTHVGDYLMAANMCTQALEYLVRLKNPFGIAKINLLIAKIFLKAGEIGTAEAFYKESMSLYEELGIPLGLANCFQAYAQLLEQTDRPEEALTYHHKARDIYQKLKLQQAENRGANQMKKSPSNVRADDGDLVTGQTEL